MNKVKWLILIVAVAAGGGWFFLIAKPDQQKEVEKRLQSAAYDAKWRAGALTQPKSQLLGNVEAARKCRENLKRIESAKRAAAQKRSLAVGTVPLDAILQEMDVRTLPRCPSGGEYTIGTLGTMVTCSIGGGGTPDKADDHIAANY